MSESQPRSASCLPGIEKESIRVDHDTYLDNVEVLEAPKMESNYPRFSADGSVVSGTYCVGNLDVGMSSSDKEQSSTRLNCLGFYK